MGGAPDITRDLPEAMTMAAFAGVAFYIAIELNVRLIFLFRRRRGLYFWSCVLCSWGVLTQPLTIILADFNVLTNFTVAVVLIYLSWWFMVVPQSFVLYSRLNLIMNDPRHLRWVLGMIIFTTVAISIPTIILGVLAQASPVSATLTPVYTIWNRFEVSAFFVQETILSTLYVVMTWRHLKNFTVLNQHDSNSRKVMKHLIYSNLVVIFLDISVISVQFANFFYVQGAFKPCVYGVKLRIEFAILNRLIKSVQQPSRPSFSDRSGSKSAWLKPQDKPSSLRSRRNSSNGLATNTSYLTLDPLSYDLEEAMQSANIPITPAPHRPSRTATH